MKAYKYIMAAACVAAGLSSCSDELDIMSGQGSAMISTSINSDVKVVTSRAGDSDSLAAVYGESLQLWLSNNKGVIRKYEGLDNLPTEALPLLSGNYLAEAWAGDSVPASWDKKWFKGSAPFTVTRDNMTPVNVECRIANVVVSVEYDDDIAALLADDITLEVGHSRGHLTFEGYDIKGKRAYFMMPSTDTDLTWTLTGTEKVDGKTIFTRTNKIADVQPAHEYIFKVSCQAQAGGEIGGGYGLNITIDDTEIYCEETIQIATAPVIKTSGFNIDEPLYCDPQEVGRRTVYIFGAAALNSVLIECDQLGSLIGVAGANDVDLLAMTPDFATTLSTAGISSQYDYDATDDSSRMKIVLDEAFTNKLTNGQYDFKITATDANLRTTVKHLIIDVSGNPLTIDEVNTADVNLTTSKAVVSGTINKPSEIDTDKLLVEYRPVAKSRDDEWMQTKATVTGTTFTATLTGLKAGTQYEWRATSGTFSTAVKKFTTEAALQLPNAGFESWQTSSSPYLIYGAGESIFWDSGNHGSATMKKNVTTPDDAVKHSGNYSIKLSSQFVGVGSIGKFAAGNVFIGQYLDTQGTDGVLGFGRPFTGRPAKLRGYVRYTPAAIAYVQSNAPAEYVKGELDRGIIYLALLDDYTESYNSSNFPVIVKTKGTKLFDKQSSHVIAYGEKVFTQDTGDGMVMFEITLDYRRTDIKPSYIMLTASASKGGDYFTGGASTMWLDDLELVYE